MEQPELGVVAVISLTQHANGLLHLINPKYGIGMVIIPFHAIESVRRKSIMRIDLDSSKPCFKTQYAYFGLTVAYLS